MGDELEQLKTVFRSLVVSSPTQMNVCSLLRDYRNMIGAPVPITKYGYRNPVEFLQERFSDCFLFSGQPSNPVLTLIVPNSLKHIDKFVQKQKSSTAKFNPKRRSVPESVVKSFRNAISSDKPQSNSTDCKPNKLSTSNEANKPNDCSKSNGTARNHDEVSNKVIEPTRAPDAASSKPIENSKTSNEASTKPNIIPRKTNIESSINKETTSQVIETSRNSQKSPSKHNSTTAFIVPNTCSNSLYNSIKEVQSPKLSKNKENANTKTTSNTTVDNAVKSFLKKRLPIYDSSQYLDEESRSPESLDDDSGKHTSSSSSSTKARQLEQLKEEIMQLIIDSPDGVWCTDLVRLYRDRYNHELNYNRFGYTSIISLIYCLEERIDITRPEVTGDWLLQDRARANLAPPAVRLRRLRTAYTVLQSSKQLDPGEALPGIDYDPDVFPDDCMRFLETIESVSLSDFRPGAMVEVMIGEVYSPSHFWFLRVGEEYNFAMEDMMDEMTHYYNNEGRERYLARGAIRVGHYCSSLFESDWHRSLIVKIIDSDTVKVRHVDYGTVDTVATSALRPLRRVWGALPAQACRARLAGVRPAAGGWRWARAACAAFLAAVSNRRLVANVVATDDRDDVAEVLLIDTSSAEDVCIGSELIRAGHADPRADCSLRKEDAYLYPRFEALESGATPNYAEIHAYLRHGLALDYVHEYRAHVPAPPSPSSTPSPPSPPSPPPTPSPPVACTPPPTAHAPHESEPPKADEAVSQPELATRIPLLLPNRPAPSKSAPLLSEPASGPVENGEECNQDVKSPPAVARRGEPPPLPPPSYLSPLAPAYVPRPAPVAPSPPPPYGAPVPALAAAECETYRVLARANPEAAHWFLLGALGQAISSTAHTHAHAPTHPAHMHLYPPPIPPAFPSHPPGFTPVPFHGPPHMAPLFPYPPHMPPGPARLAPPVYTSQPTPRHPCNPIPPTTQPTIMPPHSTPTHRTNIHPHQPMSIRPPPGFRF